MGGQAQRRSGLRMRPIRVEEIIEEDVVTAERDTSISEVVSKMSEEGVGSVVVVEDDQPVGIISDRKIALALEGTPDIANKQAGDLVGGDLITGTASMSVFDALQQLSDEEIRRLPIVDDSGHLQGIITLDDILVLLGSELNKAGETIKGQSPRL
jgi:CBS domain-containing protein